MRLPKLRSVNRPPVDSVGQKSKNGKILQLLAKVIVIAILAVAIGAVWHKVKHRNEDRIPNASASAVDALKNSNDINDQRSLGSEYIASGDYPKAEAVARKVADRTNDVNDYLTLLNICAYYSVPDKQGCINYVVSKVSPQINKLSFYSAYTAGSELDEAGFKKDAVTFYQKAYDIYDPARADQYTKTKDQLKQRIDELSK
jgi:tetratricopeptide (TPR) repeat protein